MDLYNFNKAEEKVELLSLLLMKKYLILFLIIPFVSFSQLTPRQLAWGDSIPTQKKIYPDLNFQLEYYHSGSEENLDDLIWLKYSGLIKLDETSEDLDAEVYFVYLNGGLIIEYYFLTPSRSSLLHCEFLSDYCNVSSVLNDRYNMEFKNMGEFGALEKSANQLFTEYNYAANRFTQLDSDFRKERSQFDSTEVLDEKSRAEFYAHKVYRDFNEYSLLNLIDFRKITLSESTTLFQPIMYHRLEHSEGSLYHSLVYCSKKVSANTMSKFLGSILD